MKSLLILLRRSINNLLRHLHTLLPLQPLLCQPIPQELLIEAILTLANLIRLRRPEPRTIRRQHLIDQDNVIRLLIQPKLKLRVRNDDAPRLRILPRRLVDLQRQLLDALGVLLADDLGGLFGGDVLVVLAEFGFGAGRVDGLWEFLGLLQAGEELLAVDLARLLVGGPGGARDVAADNGFNGEDLELADEHGARGDVLSDGCGDGGGDFFGQEVGV
jgi:hypothetical protein